MTARSVDGRKVALVVDFDNTLTAADVGDLVADRFGDPRWHELQRALHRGEATVRELIGFMFGTMRVLEAELVAYAREVGALRAGAAEFLRAARRASLPVTIASGGLDVYIRGILGGLGEGIELVSNRARLSLTGAVIEFPEEAHGCGECGNCKGAVVETLRGRGYEEIIAVGDGTSDRCLSRTADVLCARTWLLSHARSQGRAVHAFDDFFEVAAVVAARVPAFARAWREAGALDQARDP